jgi:hypothetical protein
VKPKKQPVRILNPITYGVNFTSLNRARRLVRRGRAVFIGGGEAAISFIESSRLRAAIENNAGLRFLRAITGSNYDRIAQVIHRGPNSATCTTLIEAIADTSDKVYAHHAERSAAYGGLRWNPRSQQMEHRPLDQAAL